MRMNVKRPIRRGKVGLATLSPTMGDVISRIPWTRFSTTACGRVGMSFGRLMARRIAMRSTTATTQLVTMLLVTGSGPILNSAVAAVSTPLPSAANAGTPVERDARRKASLVTRDMVRADGWKGFKRVVVGKGPSLRQQPKSNKLCRPSLAGSFQVLSAVHVLD